MEPSEPREQGKLTHADYLLFPDDGRRHELIAGEHLVSPTPTLRHQTVVLELAIELGTRVRERGLGRLFIAPLDVILSDFDVVEPDLLFVRRGREEILRDWVRGAPDLVVEVLSPSTRRRDETTKREFYARHGVPEYWIVDPEEETVRVHRLQDDVYGEPELLRAGEGRKLVSTVLGEIELDLERLFDTGAEGGGEPR